MLIDWNDRGTRPDARCPVCGHRGEMAQPFSYRAESLREVAGTDRVALLRCPSCDVRFCDPLAFVDYQDADARGAKFYLESGAGIDVMLEALALADARPVARYLEIGCSFGFIMDYARRMLGWEVRGFDPGALARLGRDILKLPIDNAFFQSGSGFDGWADLVFCSEVIEHVPDPKPFLDLLGSALAPDGQLILTTPNGDALAEQADPAVLSAILSPGHHIILYNPASIEALLKRHGFAEVRVEENGFQLRVAASRGPMRGRSTWFDRDRYRDYLAALLAEAGADSPLGAGIAYRLFKEQVNGGRFAEAARTYAALRTVYRARYGFDLDDPAAIPVPAEILGFEALGERWPFNLTGLLHFHGIVDWLGNGQPAKGAASFRAAARIGRATRRALRTAGVDDLEMADLGRQAGLARLSALAQYDPAGAVEALLAFVETLPDDDGPAARAELALQARRRLFLDLVNLGHLTEARQALAEGGLELADPPAAAELPLAFALGLVCLNRSADYAAAAKLFGHVAEGEVPQSRRLEAVLFRLSALAQSAPDEAAEAFLELDAADPLRAEARRRLFTDLVNLGHMAAAERVLEDEDLGLADPPTADQLPALFARAVYLMNHKSDFAAAADLFAEVAEGARGSAAEQAFFWTARFHHGIARRFGGEDGEAVAAEMRSPAEGLPPVPEALLNRIGELSPAE
jgi:SAM-dependent methyltransferase